MKKKTVKDVTPEVSSEEDFSEIEENDSEVENDSEIENNSEVESDSKIESDSTENLDHEEGDSDTETEQDSDTEGLDGSHKKSLAKLQKTDPEFYKFLKENDKKLLEFSSSDEEEGKDGSDDDGDEVFKPPTELHEDSEDSDFEADGKENRSSNVISLAMVAEWRENLISNPCVKSISDAVEAFNAALARVTGDGESVLKVEGSGVFNAIVEMCVLYLQKSINDFLKLDLNNTKLVEKAKKWVKIKSIVERYFTDLFKLLEGVCSENITSVLLKHLHSCCGMIVYFHKLSKIALKHLTKLWSTGEEAVRVLAYLCILRICIIKKSNLLNSALKLLYIAYIKCSNFVSINTLPQINFMKRSLVDLYALDPALSYQHAFMYIRQLAIHLRNAITLHKKTCFQSVYNWQYIHSLRLWVDLFCETKVNSELNQLIYPLVMVIIGVIKLIPTSQHVPLRFHCIQMLIKLNRETGVYIPVLPFIIDSLTCCDINKQHKKVSMKPYDFTFVLQLSKAAMNENGFPDAVVEYAYQLLLEAGSAYSNNIAFPDLVVPTLIQLKSIVNNCKTSKYVNKLKQVILKIEENSKFILDERNKFNLNLNESEKVKAFESDMKLKGSPLQKYWVQVEKLTNEKKKRDLRASEDEKQKAKKEKQPKDVEIPKIKKSGKRKKNDDLEFLPSDDSDFEFPAGDDSDNNKESEKPIKKRKKVPKIAKPTQSNITEEKFNDEEDLLEDLNMKTF